jgi:hypothetical protein
MLEKLSYVLGSFFFNTVLGNIPSFVNANDRWTIRRDAIYAEVSRFGWLPPQVCVGASHTSGPVTDHAVI